MDQLELAVAKSLMNGLLGKNVVAFFFVCAIQFVCSDDIVIIVSLIALPTDIDECQRPGVCGTGAICVNNPGSHECRCPDGTAPEPDARTKCVSLLRCAIDDDCPGNAVCDPTKECLCPEPNVGKDCRRK